MTAMRNTSRHTTKRRPWRTNLSKAEKSRKRGTPSGVSQPQGKKGGKSSDEQE
jgi:hypothetical protein